MEHQENHTIITTIKITLKEVLILLDFLEKGIIDERKIYKLNRAAQRLLKRNDISSQDKKNLLHEIKIEFKKTQQPKIPINDITARIMKNKKGNSIIGHNIQSAVDVKTSLICGINVSSNPYGPL